jgi:hypothetical protein
MDVPSPVITMDGPSPDIEIDVASPVITIDVPSSVIAIGNDKGKNINCKLQREGRSIVMTREGNQLQ